jgi:hypothetical protein
MNLEDWLFIEQLNPEPEPPRPMQSPSAGIDVQKKAAGRNEPLIDKLRSLNRLTIDQRNRNANRFKKIANYTMR